MTLLDDVQIVFLLVVVIVGVGGMIKVIFSKEKRVRALSINKALYCYFVCAHQACDKKSPFHLEKFFR